MPARPTSYLNVAAIAGALAVLLAFGWLFEQLAVDFPRADDYTQLLAVPRYVSVQADHWSKLAYVFSPAPSAEHRIATLRLVALAQASVGQLDFRAMLLIGNAVMMVAAALLTRAAPAPCRAAVAAATLALLLSPANYDAQFWPTGALSHLALAGYAFAAVWLAAQRSRASAAAALLLACTASLTLANGLLVFPAAAVVTYLDGRRKHALLWLGIGVLLGAVYFLGAQTAVPAASARGIDRAALMMRFAATMAGSVAQLPTAALAAGVVLAAASLWLALRRDRTPPLLYGWLVFLWGSCAAMALGRASLGDAGALVGRYKVYSELIVLTLLVAVLLRAKHLRRQQAIAAAATVAALAWFAAMWQTWVPQAANYSVQQAVSRAHYVATGHPVTYGFPEPGFAEFMLAQGRSVGYFKPDEPAPSVATLRASPPGDLAATAVVIQFVAGASGILSVSGLWPSSARAATLWLEDGERRRYAAPLALLRHLATPWGREWRFAWGTVRVPDPAESYRVGVGLVSAEGSVKTFWTDTQLGPAPGKPGPRTN